MKKKTSIYFWYRKVKAIFSRFQEKHSILLKLVWTNTWSLDKSRKQTKKLSKHSFFTVFFCIFAHYNCMTQKGNIVEFPQAKSVVVSGDIHGDITPLIFKCCVQYGMTDTLIIAALALKSQTTMRIYTIVVVKSSQKPTIGCCSSGVIMIIRLISIICPWNINVGWRYLIIPSSKLVIIRFFV